MQITITLDTDNLSTDQVSALGTLVGTGSGETPAPVAKATPAPAAKKAAAPKAEATPEPEAEEETSTDGPTKEDAVALATKLVSNGEAAKVKAALGEVGAKKVSEIPEEKVAEFVAALS